jgi:hypothetical protein
MEIQSGLKCILVSDEKDENGYQKPFTYRQIRDFLNTASDDILDQDSLIWGSETGGQIYSLSITTEPFINPSGECCEPKSQYANSEDDEDREIADMEPHVLEAGRLIIEADI